MEAQPESSNQHEFNGVQALKILFGEARHKFDATFVYFSAAHKIVTSAGFVTWYDAREHHPTRSEFRLYFSKTQATELLVSGDLALILRKTDGSVLIAFAAGGSLAEEQLMWLFELATPNGRLSIRDIRKHDAPIDFAGQEILTRLGIHLPQTESSGLSLRD